MAYKITGTVLMIGDTQTLPSRSGTQFTKRDLVITVRKFDPYTGVPSEEPGNTPKFTFMNSNCQQLDNIKVGDIVTVLFDIAGRSYEKEGKKEYYTDVRPFRVEVQRQPYQQSAPVQSAEPEPELERVPEPSGNASPAQGDDLPF